MTLKRLFISDCEGPISKNDNAFEAAAHFVPDGDRLFTLVSKYDDVLADMVKKDAYCAGSTLKLILPFLKAYDVTDRQLQEFSAQSLLLISGIKDTLQHIQSLADAFIVSTSYEHYIKALCKAVEFPCENTYCTQVQLDKYTLNEQEKTRLKEIIKEIVQMPLIEIPSTARSLSDLSRRDQETVRRLDEVFWAEIACMSCSALLSEVTIVGGGQKAKAIKDVAKKLQAPISDAMYVGDSITDVEAFKLTRENGGLTVSFNGNAYAVKNAEIAVLSENSIVTAIIADIFCRYGREQTLQILESWSWKALKQNTVNPLLLDRLFTLYPNDLPKVQIVTAKNMEALSKESNMFRKKVRGEAIGRLG